MYNKKPRLFYYTSDGIKINKKLMVLVAIRRNKNGKQSTKQQKQGIAEGMYDPSFKAFI